MEMQYPKFRWFVMVAMIVATIVQGMVLIAPSPLIQPISETLGLSLGQTTGALMLPFTICIAIAGIAGGFIVDKIGLPKTYLFATIIMVIGSVAVLFSGTNVTLIAIGRVLGGLGGGPVIATIAKVTGSWFPMKERALITGFQGASLAAGITIGLQAGPRWFSATGDWNQAISFTGFFGIVVLILCIIWIKGPAAPVTLASETESVSEIAYFKLAIKQPAFYLIVLSAFSVSWAQQAYNDLTPGNIAADAPVGLGYGPLVAGSVMGANSLAYLVGSLVSGILLNAVFRKKFRLMLPIAFVLTAIFCASVLFRSVTASVATITVCLIIAGFFMGLPQAINQSFIAMSYPPGITGKIGGMTMGLGIIGGSVGVAVGSVALHVTGAYHVSVLIVVGVCVFGAVVSAFTKRPKFDGKVFE